jgi:chaperone BCS1
MKVLLGNISQKSAEEMFVRMFSHDLGCASVFTPEEIRKLAVIFASKIPNDVFTPSLLQGFFQLHLDSPRDAVATIDAWVEKELAKRSDREFEMVNGGKRL